MDRDSTPIGGLSKPLQPTRQLFYASIILDILAITASFFLSIYFALGILLYILASRTYSYRGIRLKKYSIAGYLVVVIFQGAVVFFLTYYGSSMSKIFNVPLLPMLAASCLIGGYYPLTQVYQHAADRDDGVQTISFLIGKRGTFIYCGIIFAIATLLIFITFKNQDNLWHFYLFAICMMPMIFFFFSWMIKVWKNESNANFKNSLMMNILAALCTAVCFLTIIIINNI